MLSKLILYLNFFIIIASRFSDPLDIEHTQDLCLNRSALYRIFSRLFVTQSKLSIDRELHNETKKICGIDYQCITLVQVKFNASFYLFQKKYMKIYFVKVLDCIIIIKKGWQFGYYCKHIKSLSSN